jgi:hypothetical protein
MTFLSRTGLLTALAFVALIAFSSEAVAGQASARKGTAGAAAQAGYKAPRTTDGQPDLQGVWGNNDATPLERPKELEGRATLTDEEVAALKRRYAELFNAETDAAFGDSVFLTVIKDAKEFKTTDLATGNYDNFWIVEREFDNRTSLVSDPATGRIPELTAEGKRRQAAQSAHRKMHPADGPEDLGLSHRCVTYGVPRLGAGYNSYFQIMQTKDTVAIVQEMVHEVRIIPLDGRAMLPGSVRQWNGDSRGRWEGETLVVETKNYSPLTMFQGLPAENLHTVERFTRVGPKTIKWEVTVNDPVTYTSPWTATLMLRHTDDEIYEMACHEGNEGLRGALSGYRAQERKAAEALAKGSK